MIDILKTVFSVIIVGVLLVRVAAAQVTGEVPDSTAARSAAASVDLPTTGVPPAQPGGVAPATGENRREFLTAIARERQTLGYVTASYTDQMPSEGFLKILPSPERQSLLRAPFGRKMRAMAVASTSMREAGTPTAACLYVCEESLRSVTEWYAKEYGLEFKIRKTLLSGSFSGDTLTVAHAVKRVGNSVISVMIWNPTHVERLRKGHRGGGIAMKTSVELQERTFRPREMLIAEGPDAVVEFTWNVPYSDLIRHASVKYQLDPYLIASLVQQESGFNPTAVSADSALGLTQLLPGTAAMMGISNPSDPAQSLDGGMRYFKQMLERFDGDVMLALAAYNAGPGNVEKYHGVPPFTETRDYVKRIMDRYQEKASGRVTTGSIGFTKARS